MLLRRPSRPALVHQPAKTSESLEDYQSLDTRLYLVNEKDSEYQDNGGGRHGTARTRRLCHHQQPFRLSRWDCSWQPFPVVFVSKSEVKSWPVVGQWTTLCGTVFINRQRKDLIPLAVKEISEKLKQQANILLFPEGAATNGERMLPFQTAPLAAPLRSRAIIVPITLAYQSVEGQPVSAANRDLIYCYDDMPDVPHFWKLLALHRVEARVTIQPRVDCSRYEDNSAGRKKLAEDCYNRILGRARTQDCSHKEGETATPGNSRGLFSS